MQIRNQGYIPRWYVNIMKLPQSAMVQSGATVHQTRRHSIRFLAVVCLTMLLPALLQAQTAKKTVTLAEYLAELKQAEQQLQKAPEGKTLQAIQRHLSQIDVVIGPDEEALVLMPLLGNDADHLPSVAQAQARLTMLITQLDSAIRPDTDAQLAALAAIFAQPAFAQQESLWQRIWRWLRRWLPDLGTGESAAPNGFANVLLYGLGYLMIAVAAFLLIWLLSIWLQNLAGMLLGNVSKQRRLTPDGELLNAAEAKAQAEQLARSGSYREAVRRLYLSALLTLDERDLLHYDRSNTNREVLATVRTNRALYERLQPVIETFDTVWYGVHEPDQSTFDQYQSAVEKLERKDT